MINPEWLGTAYEKTSSCETCGICNVSKTWSVPHLSDTRERRDLYGQPYILVVGSQPTRSEDENGKFNKSLHHWEFPLEFMNARDCRWVATTAITCYPGNELGKDKKPSKQQLSLCSSQNIDWLVTKYKVKVIVCLGAEAMKGVLGKYAPNSVSAIGTTPFRVPGTDTVVITLDHPNGHNPLHKTRPKDLFMQYLDGFEVAQKLAIDGIPEHEIDWFEVKDPKEVILLSKEMPTEFSFDVEDDHWEKDPVRASVNHPGVKLLCLGLSYEYKGKYRQPILTGAAAYDHRGLEAIFYDRIASGYNVKYDATALDAITGFNLFNYVKPRFIAGFEVPGINDPFIQIYISNQAHTGNALSKIVTLHWGVDNWKMPLKQALSLANAQIRLNNSLHASLRKNIVAVSKYNEF